MKLYKFFHFAQNKNECAIVWFRFSTSEKLPFPLFFIIKLLILNLPVYQATSYINSLLKTSRNIFLKYCGELWGIV